MIKYYGNKDLLKGENIGICGSLYPSEYGIKVVKDFVKKQSKTLVFHNEIGIAKAGINQALIQNKKIIVISKKKIFSDFIESGNVLFIEVESQDNIEYLNLFEKTVQKLAIVELSKTSSLMEMIDEMIENSKEIYVIPGTIYSSNSTGTNLLIAEGANLLYDELEI